MDEFSGLKTYKKPEFLEQRVFEPSVQRQIGDAFYSAEYKGHIIRVGKLAYLENWNQVNTNDNNSYVKGLHIGRLKTAA